MTRFCREIGACLVWCCRGIRNCFVWCWTKLVDFFFWFYNFIRQNQRQNIPYALKTPSHDPDNIRSKVISKLQKQLRCSNVDLCELPLSEASTSSIPVLVFCLLTSRIGEDIDDALTGINRGCNIKLILIHLKRKFTLEARTLSNDENLLENEYHVELRTNQQITHFAFDERDGGLYDHPQNTEGMKRLVELIKN